MYEDIYLVYIMLTPTPTRSQLLPVASSRSELLAAAPSRSHLCLQLL